MAVTLQTALRNHQMTDDFSQIGKKNWVYLSYDSKTGWDVVKFEGICGLFQQFLRWLGFYSSIHLETIVNQIRKEPNVPQLLLDKIQDCWRAKGNQLPAVTTGCHSFGATIRVEGGSSLTFESGDITSVRGVEAIVNAANRACLGGAGIDAAIHRAAGQGLVAECRELPVENGVRCQTGKAVYTRSHNLAAKGIGHIIHTVGPDMREAPQNPDELLKNCYINSLNVAHEHGIRKIAFPAISTGIYEFDKTRAAQIAGNSVKQYLEQYPGRFDEVKLVYLNGNLAEAAFNAFHEESSD